MTEQAAAAPGSARPVEYAPVQEMRLAVVMYGGVSLAIYMNGVAQELLNLVKSTAPGKDAHGDAKDGLLLREEDLPSTARVYRKLGRLLGRTNADGPDGAGGPVRTRFVIDIVTGTSAGGINGVFLAKALANQAEMVGLTRMWREDGDLPKLLNDGSDPSTLTSGAPDALLNSRQITGLFYKAITDMDRDGGGRLRPDLTVCKSPYVEELDLFVTTTDMAGLLLPIRLEDRVIYERRYRNFYHFRYGYPASSGAPYNAFQPLNSTFLAFACRCTSAFPFAFAPMDLNTAVNVCRPAQIGDWTGFFRDYLNAARTTAEADGRQVPRDEKVDFAHRYFIDGGCLDNKPFSYAIDALRWKKSDIPVTRKLFYVEPAPAHPEFDRDSTAQPDALDSVYAGYVDLPRAENIREDLQRLVDRNRLIGRLRDALNVVCADTRESETGEWRSTSMRHLCLARNPAAGAYASYQRMKVSAVTDAIADTIACAAGLDAESDDALAVRYLVKAWRNDTYPDIANPALELSAAPDNAPTFADFLLEYDLDYRVRRLSFVRRAIDSYYRHYAELPDADGNLLRELRQAKRKVNQIRRRLLRTDALARSQDPGSGSPILPVLKEVEESLGSIDRRVCEAPGFSGLVQCILDKDSEEDRLEKARELIGVGGDRRVTVPIRKLAETLAALYAHGEGAAPETGPSDQRPIGTFEASQEAVATLKAASADVPRIDGVPSLLDSYFGYESYDAATFPLLYGTGVGEVIEVEAIRISPDDAEALCKRRAGTAKLAGDSLGHFGGFLAQDWREHDILWGRLDGVDRIINGLAPDLDKSIRTDLIKEGQIAALDEWLNEIGSAMTGTALYGLLTDSNAPVPSAASASGRGWQLTPKQVVESAREGAAEALQCLTPTEAVRFGERTLAVVSAMASGMADRRKSMWARTPLSVARDLLQIAYRALKLEYWPWLVLLLAATASFVAAVSAWSWPYAAIGALLLVGAVAGAWLHRWLARQTVDILGARDRDEH